MKYRLKITSGASVGQAHDLSPTRTTIGSAEGADIHLEGLEAHRLSIEQDANGLTLSPISGASVFVNGERIESAQALQSGDEIRVGTHYLMLQAPGLRPQRVLHQVSNGSKRRWPWAIAVGLILVAGGLWWLGSQHPETIQSWLLWLS